MKFNKLSFVPSSCCTCSNHSSMWGGFTDTDNKGNANEGAAADLEGSVTIDGSGTVYPLMAKIAEEYMVNEQENVSVEVSRAGTSAGFKKFLIDNGTDFNDASRQIKEEETS